MLQADDQLPGRINFALRNKYGLDRDIPEAVKRQVRKECGFGCVVCGLAVCQYEHVEPTFAEAKEHDPKGIALLCGACHDKVTRGVWSKHKVWEARANPRTFLNGYAIDAFDFRDPFVLHIGSNTFEDVRCIVQNESGEEWFSVRPPEDPSGPPRIDAIFYSPEGSRDLEIRGNEWRCHSSVWDLKVEGARMQLYCHQGKEVLRMRAVPPHGLEIERLIMLVKGRGIQILSGGSVKLLSHGTEVSTSGSQARGVQAVFRIPK